jgi:hypothetical protein
VPGAPGKLPGKLPPIKLESGPASYSESVAAEEQHTPVPTPQAPASTGEGPGVAAPPPPAPPLPPAGFVLPWKGVSTPKEVSTPKPEERSGGTKQRGGSGNPELMGELIKKLQDRSRSLERQAPPLPEQGERQRSRSTDRPQVPPRPLGFESPRVRHSADAPKLSPTSQGEEVKPARFRSRSLERPTPRQSELEQKFAQRARSRSPEKPAIKPKPERGTELWTKVEKAKIRSGKGAGPAF